MVAFKFSAKFKVEYPQVEQKWIQTLLRSRAWIVPNYELPNDGPEILRVVIRERFTEDLVEKLVRSFSLPLSRRNIETDRVRRSLPILSKFVPLTFNCRFSVADYLSFSQITEGLMTEGGPGHAAALHAVHTTKKTRDSSTSHGEGVRASGHDSVC